MKISKNSWHYKMLNQGAFGLFEKRYPSQSLCLYFWQVVYQIGALFLWLPFMGFLFVSVFAVGPLLLVATWFLAGELLTSHQAVMQILPEMLAPMVAAGMLGLVLYVFVIVAFFCAGLSVLPKKIRTNQAVDSKPSLVIEYVKAKKQKICPILEFTDDN